jgi:transcriptional regulator with XRE-family HTH domain
MEEKLIIQKAIDLKKKGLSIRQIAKELDCSKSTVHRWVKDYSNREELPCLCPYCATDNAIVHLIKGLQISSFHMNDDFKKLSFPILLELLSHLITYFNEDGDYETEKELVMKLYKLSNPQNFDNIYDQIADEIDYLIDFYEDLEVQE